MKIQTLVQFRSTPNKNKVSELRKPLGNSNFEFRLNPSLRDRDSDLEFPNPVSLRSLGRIESVADVFPGILTEIAAAVRTTGKWGAA